MQSLALLLARAKRLQGICQLNLDSVILCLSLRVLLSHVRSNLLPKPLLDPFDVFQVRFLLNRSLHPVLTFLHGFQFHLELLDALPELAHLSGVGRGLPLDLRGFLRGFLVFRLGGAATAPLNGRRPFEHVSLGAGAPENEAEGAVAPEVRVGV